MGSPGDYLQIGPQLISKSSDNSDHYTFAEAVNWPEYEIPFDFDHWDALASELGPRYVEWHTEYDEDRDSFVCYLRTPDPNEAVFVRLQFG